MSVTLQQILSLTGRLDDSSGDNTARERFRQFLRENISKVGEVRDYIDECLRASSDHQYSRALQDLVNYIGHFLGFEVAFGRYQGIQGQVGFDGHWQSSTGFHVVVEVKTSETYPIKTVTLVNYIDTLISDRQLPDWDYALGLYVIGKPNPEIRQLEHAILAERRTHQLRIISVESLLSLAELMDEYEVSHDDVLAVLRPSGPTIDSVIDIMTRLVAQQEIETLPAGAVIPEAQTIAMSDTQVVPQGRATEDKVAYWLTSVRPDETATAEEVIQQLIGTDGIYAFGENTPGRKHLKPGDWIAFYATSKGVVAHAKIVSLPVYKFHPSIRHSERYPWVFQVEDACLYFDEPIVIDAILRSRLDQFDGGDASTPWAWFVQSTRKLSAHDFGVLTGQEAR